MPRFLTTLPVNYGYYSLGNVEAYPTGGTGPTAFGPTSYFGSDPLPERGGDSINNTLYLGDLSSGFRSIDLSSKHGGNTRIQSTFYKFILTSPRGVQIVQNYSPTSYQSNTNRNTIVSVYRIEDGTHRTELPINNFGYVYKENSIVEDDSYSQFGSYQDDYPTTTLEPGTYILLITNDIRYIDTTYSFTLNSYSVDWGAVLSGVEASFDFARTTEAVTGKLDFGFLSVTAGTKTDYPYSSSSSLGYTRAGVSP